VAVFGEEKTVWKRYRYYTINTQRAHPIWFSFARHAPSCRISWLPLITMKLERLD
jgi:hypothetical protein